MDIIGDGIRPDRNRCFATEPHFSSRSAAWTRWQWHWPGRQGRLRYAKPATKPSSADELKHEHANIEMTRAQTCSLIAKTLRIATLCSSIRSSLELSTLATFPSTCTTIGCNEHRASISFSKQEKQTRKIRVRDMKHRTVKLTANLLKLSQPKFTQKFLLIYHNSNLSQQEACHGLVYFVAIDAHVDAKCTLLTIILIRVSSVFLSRSSSRSHLQKLTRWRLAHGWRTSRSHVHGVTAYAAPCNFFEVVPHAPESVPEL